MKNKFAIGVTLFGLYFIADSFIQLYMKLFSSGYYLWYSSIFQPLPDKIIFLRYVLSIIFRVIELAFGLGVLYRKNAFRKLAIFISWFTIAIIYWKHPPGAFTKHANAVISHFYPTTSCQLSSPAYTKMISLISLGLVYALDIGICAFAIYYFTRPRIKEEFKK